MDQAKRITRGVKTSRGLILAAASTLIAAIAHMAAGGNTPTPVALGATLIVSLPLTVWLTTSTFTALRTLLSVSFTQGLFHWLFVWVGTSRPGSDGNSEPLPAHAEHLGLVADAAPILLESAAAAEAAMWASHGLAALLTVVIVRRGERALIALQKTLVAIVFPRVPTSQSEFGADPAPRMSQGCDVPTPEQLMFDSCQITHRGPPRQAVERDLVTRP